MSTDNRIILNEKTVTRPLTASSHTVHALLAYLKHQGFEHGPSLIAIDGKHEIVSKVKGDTYDYPLTGAVASVNALVSAAKMQRALHDASKGFAEQADHPVWMWPAQTPVEVICHGDFTPYNLAFDGEFVCGVFDFDTAHPGPRIWDLGWSIYCWAPFKTHFVDKMGTLEEQIKRAKLYCDAYGLNASNRAQLTDYMIQRLASIVDFMRERANEGDAQFLQNIQDGHHVAYLKDIEYIKHNHNKITSGVCA